MTKKCLIFILSIACLSISSMSAYEPHIGFVDFKECLEKSKQGMKEKTAFEDLKNQMQAKMKESESELEDLAKKLEDVDYMDGLSPSAEQELKFKFQNLSQEFARFQNQYYQLLNQANMRLVQSLHQQVSSAANKVREKQNLDMILNEDSVFASAPSLDCTDAVIKEMDRRFELENREELPEALR